MVKVAGMAPPQFIFITADQRGDLSHGRSILHCRTDLAYRIVAARLELTEVETNR